VFLTDSFSSGGLKIDATSAEFLRSLMQRAPVIVMSARTWAKTAQPSDLGVAAVLPKPFDIEELLGAVRSIAG
jgi:DNA-binding response OmpR family regulator